MTNSKELQAVAELLSEIHYKVRYETPSYRAVENSVNLAREKLSAAVNAMQVREMTVEEVARIIFEAAKYGTLYDSEQAAHALAKLGTIRIVGGGE